MIPACRQQIHKESKHVEREDEGNDPFEDGSDLLVGGEGSANEHGGEEDFEDNEEELHPEGGAEDAVLAKMDAEALIFGADEDGGDDVAGAVHSLA